MNGERGFNVGKKGFSVRDIPYFRVPPIRAHFSLRLPLFESVLTTLHPKTTPSFTGKVISGPDWRFCIQFMPGNIQV
jgi:hypothetical protein